jgi:polysaccharide biosynthesis/export protein
MDERGARPTRLSLFKGLRGHADNWRALNDMCTSTSLRRSPGVLLLLSTLAAAAPALAQTQAPPPATRPGAPQPTQPTTRPAPPTQGAAVTSTGIATPTDYVIGPDDILGVVFWRDADMTQDVTVRPDGHITLPLLKDVRAAGLTPSQLAEQIQKAATQFIEDPNVTIVVRQINSRNVFVTGQVMRPGGYPVSGQMTVLQLIAIAGGLTEFADGKAMIMRAEGGKQKPYEFNYNDVSRGKKLEQNIVLKPGDTVTVR